MDQQEDGESCTNAALKKRGLGGADPSLPWLAVTHVRKSKKGSSSSSSSSPGYSSYR